MAKQLFSNGASCFLGAAITTTGPIVSFPVEAGQGAEFPSPSGGDWFVAAVWKANKSAFELFRITGRTGDVFTVDARAFDGSTANTFAITDFVYCVANAGSFADLQSAIAALQADMTAAEAGIAALETAVDAAEVLIAQKPRMDIGTRTLFHQAAAPVGWTQDNALNDRVLRLVSGTGGGTGGSWTISGISVDGHALTEAQMPAHTHTVGGQSQAGVIAFATGIGSTWLGFTRVETTSSVGGGAAHAHGLTIGNTWRPSYTDVIVAARAS